MFLLFRGLLPLAEENSSFVFQSVHVVELLYRKSCDSYVKEKKEITEISLTHTLFWDLNTHTKYLQKELQPTKFHP